MTIRLPVIGELQSDRLSLIRRAFSENFRRHLGRYLIAFTFMAVVAASTAITAWLIKDFVNQVFIGKDPRLLWILVAAVLGLAIAKGAGAYFSEVALSSIGNAIIAASQRRMFAHILDLDVAHFTQTRSSEMIARISQNATDTRDLLQVIVTAYGRDLLTVTFLIAVMIVQEPFAALLVAVFGPLLIYLIGRLVTRLRTTYTLGFWAMTRVVGTLQQSVQGIRTVKAYNLAPVLGRRMDEAIEDTRRRSNKVARLLARSSPVSELLAGLAIAGVIGWGGYSVIYLGEQPGEFISFLAALMLAYDPMRRLGRNHLVVERGLVGIKLMYDLLDLQPTVTANQDAPDLAVNGSEIRFDDVHFSYEPTAPLFAGLNFLASAGKTTALVGPSGGGKSSVMALIERFYDPTQGRILIDDQNIAKVGLTSLRQSIAFVSQESFLFEGSIADNIALGREGASRPDIEAAGRAAMADDFIRTLPQGYDTSVGEQGANLSGGQRQRIAIARAILRDAPIVLLDEATSALDAESEHLLQIAFDRLMRGRTTIVVAHRLSTVLNADRICVMAAGRIVEEGRHAELLAADGLYARLYRLQFDPEARSLAAASSG